MQRYHLSTAPCMALPTELKKPWPLSPVPWAGLLPASTAFIHFIRKEFAHLPANPHTLYTPSDCVTGGEILATPFPLFLCSSGLLTALLQLVHARMLLQMPGTRQHNHWKVCQGAALQQVLLQVSCLPRPPGPPATQMETNHKKNP